jgi:hypothetical protein
MFLYKNYLLHVQNDTDMESWGIGRKKGNSFSSTLSTVNPTGTDLCSNPDCSNEKPASNQLSHDLAKAVISTGGLLILFGSQFLLY